MAAMDWVIWGEATHRIGRKDTVTPYRQELKNLTMEQMEAKLTNAIAALKSQKGFQSLCLTAQADGRNQRPSYFCTIVRSEFK